jgi:hypothetical protein
MLHNYIELIDGGFPNKGEQRKNVIQVKDMEVKKGYETYRSLWNYDESYYDYVGMYNTVTGYQGKHNSDILFFDLDIDKDQTGTFQDVRQEAINLAEMLIYAYDIPADLIHITFSGGKGFHIIVPFQVVQSDTVMTEDFCEKYGELIKIITKDFNYVDTSIYNINRVIRVVNTQHGKSKLYKIPVTLNELKNKNFDIKATAKHKRNADMTYFYSQPFGNGLNVDEIVPSQELNDIWRDIKIVKKDNNFSGHGENTFIDAFEETNPKGRHQALAKIVGKLVDKDIDFDTCMPIVTLWNEKLVEPMTPERLDKDVRGLYKSFWNRRPNSKSSEQVDPRSAPKQDSKPITETSLKDILVYGYKYKEQYDKHITEISRGGRIKFGYNIIDDPIRGMIAGEVAIIVGKTSVGKSAFVQNILLNMVDANRTVLFFSLEMPLPTVAERTLQMKLQKSGRHIEEQFTTGDAFIDREAESAFKALDNFITIPIQGIKYDVMERYIFETEEILKKKIDVVAIDYAGLMKMDGGSLYEQQSEISRDLKALSGRTHSAVVSLAQVSKNYDEFAPIDLDATRDSGVITEAGDYVIGLWRAKGHDDKYVLLKGNVCKNRNGAKVNFDAKFNRSSLLFTLGSYIPEGDDDDLPF